MYIAGRLKLKTFIRKLETRSKFSNLKLSIFLHLVNSQALMEQHAVLTPSLLGEIIMSNVSETTGQLSAPVVR